jgi:uncharacterized protein YwlG (UPF0340 family)
MEMQEAFAENKDQPGCPAEHIPPKIEVDLTNTDVGDRVLMHDIPVHPSLKLLGKAICSRLRSRM